MDLVKIAKWIVNPDSMGCTDEEFVELMALITKYRKDGNKTDPNLTVADVVTMDIDEVCNWFRDCLKEIVTSDDIDASAWWKPQENDEFVLTEQGRAVCETFVAECTAKRKEVLDARLDTADETTLPTVDDIENDLNWTGMDDEHEYYNGWGVTDSSDYDLSIRLQYGVDFIPKRLAPVLKDDERTKKEYYQKLFDEKYDKLLEEAKNQGCPDPELEANEAFNECATAEEIVGYYIAWHGDDAFRDWVENSQFYERERGETPSEQDRTVTRILGELYNNTVVKGIEWYIPEGTPVNPKLSEVKVIPKVTGRTDEECTEAVRLYLQLTYATEPKAFSFMLPDGRMAGYRNWELSSTTKKDDDVGCYGAGSEPCLNGCTGCDSLKRELKFATPKEMEVYLKDGDAYNPITETFVSQYNDDGAIVVYTGVSVKRARQLADETRHAGEESWLSVIGPGGAIYEKDDLPFNNAAESWLKDNFSKDGWVVADTDTFSHENTGFIHHAWDFDPVDWVVGISGSDMDDVIVKVVTGTTDTIKRHLLMEVQKIRADRKNNGWNSVTEKIEDIMIHDDGKLYAYACFRDCHFDLTATPMPNVQHIIPFH